MTRKGKILTALIVVPVLLVVAAVALTPKIVTRFTPQIRETLSKSLGAPVEFNSISLALLPRLAFSVEELRVKTDSEQNPLEVGEAQLRINLLGLLSGSINVENVLLKNVTVDVVRDRDGAIALRGVPKKRSSESSSTRRTGQTQGERTTDEVVNPTAGSSVAISINEARVENLSLAFEDRSGDKPRNLTANNLKAVITLEKREGTNEDHFTLDLPLTTSTIRFADQFQKESNRAFHLRAKGVMSSGKRSISLSDGSLELDRSKLSFKGRVLPVAELNLTSRLHPLSLPDVVSMLPALKSMEIGGSIQGELQVVGPLDDKGFPKITAKLQLSDIAHRGTTDGRRIDISSGLVEIDGKRISLLLESLDTDLARLTQIDLKGTFDSDSITLDPLTFELAQGSGRIEGSIQKETKNQSANERSRVKIALNSMELSELTGAFLKDSAVKISGKLQSASTEVAFHLNDLKRSLSGDATALLGPGSIDGINIFQSVMNELTTLPVIGDALRDAIPEEYVPLLTAQNTAFDRFHTKAQFAEGGHVTLQELTLEHSLYRFDGSGSMHIAGNFDLKTRMSFGRAFVARLVEKNKNLKYALNESGGLEIPVIIRKVGPNIMVLPDAERLIENAARAGAADAASRAIEKVAPGLGGAADALKGLFR